MTKSLTIYNFLASSPLPITESEMILAFVLNKSREFVLTHPHNLLSLNITQKTKKLFNKRLEGQPLAYLLGTQNFYGYNLAVNRHVLIPRPETELIIDFILADLSFISKAQDESLTQNFYFADIGTGSGAIIVALAQEISKSYEIFYQKSQFYGLDISNLALKVAAKNLKTFKLSRKITLLKSNLTQKLPQRFWQNNHIILSANLPYLTKKQITQERSIQPEPIIALDGGYEGLELYKQLFKQILHKDFNTLDLYCEIDPRQTKLIQKLAMQTFKDLVFEIKILKDLRKKNRFLKIKLRKRLKI